MSKFEDIQQETPRLVVTFRRDGDKEMFQWGIVGSMPILTLIGYIGNVEHELPCVINEEDDNFCPELALVIVWYAQTQSFDWFSHPDIPPFSLKGMLVVIKTILLTTKIARLAAAQQVQILGPDGQVMRR